MAGKEGTQRVGIEGPKTARTKCPNCHKNYRLTDGKNTSSKQEPLLLWCGHGVCEKCVSDSVYTCTICEKETKTDQELTKHCYIMGTVINERNEMLKMKFHSHWDEPHQMVQNKKDMCQECNKHKASVRCKICVSQLCRKCFKKIHSHRIMRSHIAEPLESLTPHYQPSSCPDHPDYTCSLLCNTCTLSGKEVFICRRCHVLGSHQQHDVTEMTSLNVEYMQEMEKLMGDFVDVIDALHTSKDRCGDLVKAVVSYGRGAILSVRHDTQQLIGLLQLREQQALHRIHDWARELSATLTTHEERLSVEVLERESLLSEARGVVRGEGCVVSPLHLLAKLRQQLSQEPDLQDPHLPQINPFRKDEVNKLAQKISQFLEVKRNDSQNLLFITPTTHTDAEDTLSSFQQSPADLNVSSVSAIEYHTGMETFRSENTVSTNSTDMLFCNDSTYTGDIESTDVALTKPVPRSLLLLQKDARKYLDSHSPSNDRKIEGCGLTQRRSGVGGEECHVSLLQFGDIPNFSNIIQKDYDGGFLLPQDCSSLQEPLSDKSKLLLEGLRIEPADSTSNVSSGASSVTIKDINTQVKSSNTLPLNQPHVSSTWDKKLKLLKWNNKWEMLGARPKNTDDPSEADRDERNKDRHMLPGDAVGGMMKRSPSLTSLHSTLSTTTTTLKPSKVTALLMEEVEVVHIKSPSMFYVQRHQDQAKAKRFFKKINAAARKSNPMMETPRCGQVYLGQYTHDDSWYRAVVNLVTSDSIHVEYIDYGNSENLPFSRLRRCPPEYQLESVPSFALVCGLHEVMPARGNSWDTEAIHTFTELVVSVSLQLFVITYTTTNNITKCQVELRRPWKTTGVSNDMPLSVREVLVILEYAVFINESPPDAYKKSREAESRKQYYQPDEIPFGGDGCTVLMSSLMSPDQFCLQLESNMAHLDKLMCDLQFYYSNPKIHCSVDWRLYAPRLGMACVAQYSCDGKWYRALVEDLPARHQVDVKYVDYGNRERLWYNKIYKITDDFLALPIQAIPCSLADIKPVNDKWPDDIVEQMVNLCEPDELKATFNTIENDVCSVYLMVTEEERDVDIAEELINLGIAVPSHIGKKLGKTERNHIGLHHIVYETPHKKGIVKSKRALSLLQKKKGLMIGDVKPFSNQYIEVEYLTLILPQCYIHVRPLSSTALYKQLQIQLKEDVEKYESNGDNRDGIDVNKGELCVVCLSRPPHFARAKVLSVIDTKVKVLLIDSGGIETVCISELYPLLEMLGRAKPLGVLVSLCDLLPPGGLSKWPGVTLDRLTEELTSHSSLYVVRKEGSLWDEELQSDILAVELGWMMEVDGGPFSANSVLHVSLNDLLVDDGLAIPHRFPNKGDIKVCEDVKVENPDSTTTINTPLNDLSAPGVNQQETQVEECVSDSENLTTATVETNDVSLSLGVQQWLPAPLPTITTFNATASYVDYEGCIYLQPQTHTRTLELIRESQTIQFAGSNPTDHDLCWSPGDPVVAQFHLDKKWYRASVNKMDKKGQVKVTFVDYGNTDTVKLSELRRNIIYADIPCLCYKSVLHNVCPITEDGKWGLKLLDFLHKTVVEKLCRVTIMEEPVVNEPLQIKLEIIEPELDLATLLVDKMKVCYFTNTSVEEQSTVDVVVEGDSQEGESTKSASTLELPLPPLPIPTAPLTLSLPQPLPPPHTLLPDNLSEKFAVKVTAIKDPACVYISPVVSDLLPTSPYQSFLTSHHQHYTQFIKYINSSIQEFPLSKNLVVGKLYLGKFITGCWYRVKVLNLTPTTVSVLYVDFGNLEVISRHCLRECPSEGQKLPSCAVCVQLHQVQPPHGQEQSWSEESMKAMINCLMGPQGHFLATIIDPGDPMQVALYSINSTADNSTLAYAEVAAKGYIVLKK